MLSVFLPRKRLDMPFGCLGSVGIECAVHKATRQCHPAGTTSSYPQLRHLRGGFHPDLNKESLLDDWLFQPSADSEILHGSFLAHWCLANVTQPRSANDVRLLPCHPYLDCSVPLRSVRC